MSIIFKTLLATDEIREECGNEWVKVKENPCIKPHWRSIEGNMVMVFPPTPDDSNWYVVVADDEIYEFAGSDAEIRAFSVATIFIKQRRG